MVGRANNAGSNGELSILLLCDNLVVRHNTLRLTLRFLLQRMEKIVETDAEQDSKVKKGKKGIKKRKKSSRQHVMLEKNNMTSYTGLRQ